MKKEEFIGRIVAEIISWPNVVSVSVDIKNDPSIPFAVDVYSKDGYFYRQIFYLYEIGECTHIQHSYFFTLLEKAWVNKLEEQKENKERIFQREG